jgi:ABC-type oligopeptide transport system substrate-binding subunit/serine/threonine protein kinase
MSNLHDYEIKDEIGSGAYGAVFRAWQPAVGREVAIKVIRPEHASEPEFVQRFEAEAQMVARLEHPHIVPVYDYWRDESGAYLVMRLLGGGSLKDALSDGPLSQEAFLQLVDDICRALSAAHARGVIHRDLKPSNILFDDDGNAYLADFGIAKNLVAEVKLTPTGAILGTPDYISPEQIKGETLTPAADQYSLGIVLFEALTGRVPYPDESVAALFHKHLSEPIPLSASFDPDLPPELDPVLQRATAKKPADRYQDIMALAEGLRAAAGGQSSAFIAQPSVVTLPPFMEESDELERGRPSFVGRAAELTWLNNKAEQAFDGQLSIVFVIGDPGAGKSSLLGAFAQDLSNAHPDLLVAWGSCNAFGGSGDPYLPFRDILSTLAGDVESRWAAGNLTGSQARELWESIPLTALSILDHGPDLVGTLVPASLLMEKTSSALPADSRLLPRLRQKAATENAASGVLEQPQLFEQVAEVLANLSEQRPLLLLLDDFQWADSGSINLLFHLGRRLTSERILIVCAYRPEELMLGRGPDGAAKRHPLLPVLDEFKRTFGDIWLDLGLAQDMAFVDAFVDSEPNRLDELFRKSLFERTRGHPLFTVELLSEMQERADLIPDEDGRWVVGPDLNWDSLPARVEGVIEARIGRLEEELREILTVAAVEGEDFTALVVARVQQLQERRLLRTLSQELERRHQLVRERSTLQLDRRLLARYRFAHAVFQRYLYNNISPVERQLLHGEIAAILEELYAERSEEIAVQLAWHFSEAGEGDRAVPYLLAAADQSRTLYAFDDATRHYERALSILKDQGDYEESSSILMKLGLAYHSAFDFKRAQNAYEEAFALRGKASTSARAAQLPPAPHALRVHSFPLRTLDPSKVADSHSNLVVSQLFRGLVALNAKFDVVPDVAQSWKVLDGGRSYIFHLRDDVYWSDGVPVTAGDFVFAWRRALSPDGVMQLAEVLYDIKNAPAFHQGKLQDPEDLGLTAIDATTLRIELGQPAGCFLQLLTIARPIPRHVVETHGGAWTESANIVTNGPFRLAPVQRHHSMELVRNPSHYGNFKGNVEHVQIRIETDDQASLEAFEANELDILSLQSGGIKQLRRVIRQHASEHESWPNFTSQCLIFSTGREPFNDPRLRRAFVLAIDRQPFAVAGAFPGAGGFVPPGLPGHVPDIALPFDPDQARRLLADAGYPDGRGFPQVRAMIARHRVNVAENLAQLWQTVLGVEITWRYAEWDMLDETIARVHPHLWTGGWTADYPDPDSFLRVGLRSLNTSWDNGQYYELVERARRSLNLETRLGLYREAELLLVQEAPILPFAYGQQISLLKPWIRGHRRSGLNDELWKDVIIDPH